MARRVVSLFVSAAFYVLSCCWRLVLFLCGRRPGATCVVLYYHGVKDSERSAFASQIDTVTRLTNPIRIDRVASLVPGKRYCGITFDDGFENTLRNAVPELAKKGVPSTIFVPGDLLGQFASWWPQATPEHCERLASAEQLRGIPAELVSIGSHTLTHPRLSLLNGAEACREIVQSRIKLEQVLGRQVTTFSFPFGEFNEELVGFCRDAGYERVFTTLPMMAFISPEEFAIGRVSAEPTDWPLEFRLKLLGAYRWLPLAYRLKRVMFSSRLLAKMRRLETSCPQS